MGQVVWKKGRHVVERGEDGRYRVYRGNTLVHGPCSQEDAESYAEDQESDLGPHQ